VNIFGMGLPEIMVILTIALLIFGPKKLPEIGRSLGKAIRGFQDASREFESEIKREVEQIEASKPAESQKVASSVSPEETIPASEQG
jgi:sec-independent protein translocase protein TatA